MTKDDEHTVQVIGLCEVVTV